MKREASSPRKDWQDLHLRYRFGEGASVQQPGDWDEDREWREDACYAFTQDEANTLHAATQDLHALCLDAVGDLVRKGDYSIIPDMPETTISAIEESWKSRHPTIAGRFDLAYDGKNPPKLLEYNADIPGTLLESAILQYQWADANQHPNQYNVIYSELVDAWQRAARHCNIGTLHMMAACEYPHDAINMDAMNMAATGAGLQTKRIDYKSLAWDEGAKKFYDADRMPIETLYTLVAWEFLAKEPDIARGVSAFHAMKVLEPAYTLLMANKAFLRLLWDRNPNHKYLLPAYDRVDSFESTFVRKAVWGRAGQDVDVYVKDDDARFECESDEPGKYIYQAYAPLPVFDGQHAVVSTWVIGGKAAGLSVREQENRKVDGNSLFVPHYVVSP